MIFKNWLDTRPKMETHDPNVYLTILGGVSRGFWTPFLDPGAQSAIFWRLKTGTFGKSTSASATVTKGTCSPSTDTTDIVEILPHFTDGF